MCRSMYQFYLQNILYMSEGHIDHAFGVLAHMQHYFAYTCSSCKEYFSLYSKYIVHTGDMGMKFTCRYTSFISRK